MDDVLLGLGWKFCRSSKLPRSLRRVQRNPLFLLVFCASYCCLPSAGFLVGFRTVVLIISRLLSKAQTASPGCLFDTASASPARRLLLPDYLGYLRIDKITWPPIASQFSLLLPLLQPR